MTKKKYNPGFKPVIFPKDSKLVCYVCEMGEQKTTGGIILTSKNVEEEAYKYTTGILVDVVHANKEDKKKFSAKIGDALHFRPYSGIHKLGEDNDAYRLLEGWEIHSIKTN